MTDRTLDDGLDQVLEVMGRLGFRNVQAFRRDPDGRPGIVIDGDRSYTTSIEILLDAELTDDWLTILQTMEGGAKA